MMNSNNFQRLGYIRSNLHELKNWCYQQVPNMTRSVSTYVVGTRKEMWFEKGWKLNKEPTLYDAPHDQRIYQLGQSLFPGNHACLFLYYEKGAYIAPHRDHKISDTWVVQVNVNCPVLITIDGVEQAIGDGEVIKFNSKLLHSVSPATSDRFVLSWRKIKLEYLNQQLSLFN